MKTYIIFSLLAVMLLGFGPTAWAQNRNDVVAEELLVDPSDDDGEDLFLFIKNTEPGTVKRVKVNGVDLGFLAAGESIFKRFTDAIYDISEKAYYWRSDVYSAGRYNVMAVKLHIIVESDIVSGQSGRPHLMQEAWISPGLPNYETAKFQI